MYGESVALSAELRIDRVCDLFEAAVASGNACRLEQYLVLTADADRSLALAELMRIELAYEQRTNPAPLGPKASPGTTATCSECSNSCANSSDVSPVDVISGKQ